MFRIRLPRIGPRIRVPHGRRRRRAAQRRTGGQLTFTFAVEQSARQRVGRMRNQLIREGRLPELPR